MSSTLTPNIKASTQKLVEEEEGCERKKSFAEQRESNWININIETFTT